tara:strand:- start:90 stop:287 length:198 start_codon:yes stop_codon:yes gene_type:complete
MADIESNGICMEENENTIDENEIQVKKNVCSFFEAYDGPIFVTFVVSSITTIIGIACYAAIRPML